MNMMTCSPSSADMDAASRISLGDWSAPGDLARLFVQRMLEEQSSEETSIADLSKMAAFYGNDGEGDADTTVSHLDHDFKDGLDIKGSPAVLGIDSAIAAIVLGDALERDVETLYDLNHRAPTVVLNLPDVSLCSDAAYALSACAIAAEATILSVATLRSLRASPGKVPRRSAAILDATSRAKSDRTALADHAPTALSLGIPVVFLCTGGRSDLPETVRPRVDATLTFGGWTAPLLAVLLLAVTGKEIEVPDEDWIGATTLDDIRSSVSERRGTAASLHRLSKTVRARLARVDALPALGELAGYGEAQEIGLGMIADIAAYRAGRIEGTELDRGLVLSGPPGTGKTFYARAFSASAGLPLIATSLAQWQAKGHLGDCLAAMRASFAEARSQAPSVLFIDELDSFGDRASFDHAHKDYGTQVVNGLLEQLDGVSDRAGVIVLGATNNVGRIDPAILRPGRLDRIVELKLPEPHELAGILRTCLGRELPDIDLMPAALAGRGGSGASAAGWVRRARGIARRAERDLTLDDLLAAIREGRTAPSGETLHRIAVHEAGHAAAAIALDLGQVHALSTSDFGGTTWLRPHREVMTHERAMKAIVQLLAGRAAETVVFGSPSAGAGGSASSDLARASRIAASIEVSWGLGASGPIWIADINADPHALLNSVAQAGSIARLLRHAEVEAERLVRRHMPAIQRCAEALIVSGYLEAKEVLDMLGEIEQFDITSQDDDEDAGRVSTA